MEWHYKISTQKERKKQDFAFYDENANESDKNDDHTESSDNDYYSELVVEHKLAALDDRTSNGDLTAPVPLCTITNTPTKNKTKAKSKERVKKPLRSFMIHGKNYHEAFGGILTEVQQTLRESKLNATESAKRSNDWILSLKFHDLIELEGLLHPILTATVEDKVVVKINELILSKTKKLLLINSLKHTTIGTFKDLTEIEKLRAMAVLIRRLVEAGCKRIKVIPIDVTTPVEEEGDILIFVIGAAIRSLSRKSDTGRKVAAKMHTDKENVAANFRSWIEAQDRGGLYYPTAIAYKFFGLLYKHIGKYYGAVFIQNRVSKAKEDIYLDKQVIEIWNSLCEGVASEAENKLLLQHCVRYSNNTIANGHLKKLREEFKAKMRIKTWKSKANAKDRQRKQLQQMSKGFSK